MCIPCIAPWLTAVLAALGLDIPLLPTGAVRWTLAALATYRVVDHFRVDGGPFGLYDWARDRLGCYNLGPDGQPRNVIARFIVCPHCQGLLWACVFAVIAMSPSLGGDLVMVIFGVAGLQSLLHTWAGESRAKG